MENKSESKGRKAKPSAADQARETVARMKQVNIQITQPGDAPEFDLVPVASITVLEQIRKTFNEDSLRELASDIARRGVLEPVIVRKTDDGQLVLVAGERRYRAAQLAGLAVIPALLRNVSESEAKADQLAENIHREELNLQEEAEMIEALYSELGSLQAVADKVHKSLAWVSKRFGLKDRLCYEARRLLEEGATEDLEILKGISTLDSLTAGTNSAWAMAEKVRKGEASRETVREKIREVKEKAKRDHEAAQARIEEENEKWKKRRAEQEAAAAAPAVKQIFNPEQLMWKVDELLSTKDMSEFEAIQELEKKYELAREKLEWFLGEKYQEQKNDGARDLLDLALTGWRSYAITTARWMKITGQEWSLDVCLAEARSAALRYMG